jgi:RNA polymerase sigma-70 factor (ECF subfamily)
VTDALENLLHLLSTGDAAATEVVFRRFEPFLRSIIRRHLLRGERSKFDSEDIVQSVWATVLIGFRAAKWRFVDVPHLRAFLVQVTRHRLQDRRRAHRKATEREQPLADLSTEQQPATAEPRPSQLAQRNELWQQILALCPPEHVEIVRLKSMGFSLAEVAAHTGMHYDSVRRVLRTLARRFAFQEPRPTPGSDADPLER